MKGSKVQMKEGVEVYHCIINPDAGRGTGRKWSQSIETFMRGQGKEIIINEPNSAQEASQWVYDVCLSGSDGIIGVGGDGTIQAIVTGMLNNTQECQIPLGIIPCGSGNDLARSFAKISKTDKLDNSTNIETFSNFAHFENITSFMTQPDFLSLSLKRILQGEQYAVDAIRVNDKACLNVANIGLDARIVRNAKRFKRILGEKAYFASAFISIAQHENLGLHIRIQDSEKEYEIDGRYTLIAVCNGQYYGGGMRIAPSARIDDGYITLCLISELSRIRTFGLFPTVLSERHIYLKEVQYIECKRCIITPTDTSTTLCMDGNLSEHSGSLEFEILPNAIRII